MLRSSRAGRSRRWRDSVPAPQRCQGACVKELVDHPERRANLSPPFRPSPARLPGGSGMKCPRCQAENPAGMRFCGQCAAPLASVYARGDDARGTRDRHGRGPRVPWPTSERRGGSPRVRATRGASYCTPGRRCGPTPLSRRVNLLAIQMPAACTRFAGARAPSGVLSTRLVQVVTPCASVHE